MKEFTLRAVLLGLVMTVVLGSANAYLGLRAGITIAATYPAAVIAMAVLRAWKGSLLEENIARTAGSIGESVAAGAIFTIPAFLLSRAWTSFRPADAYWKSTALIMVGSILGVLFISLVRRVMVEDPELPFPESVAAAEIHKAGQRGAQAAKYLFWNIGIGGVVYMLGRFGLFAADKDFHPVVGSLGHSQVRLGTAGSTNLVAAGGTSMFAAPSVSPAYLGVGYIIGLRLAALQFAGGVLAWGLMVPLLIFFLGPQLKQYLPSDTPDNWAAIAAAVWRFIVRPIAVGGMLVGAAYTLFKMRKSLTAGLGKAFADLRQTAAQRAQLSRTEQYMSSKVVFGLIALMFVLMCFLYIHITGLVWPAILAAVVMIFVGFFFATVSGNLVGFIGSSNNPISGLTLSTLLVAALLMVALGVSGNAGVAAVLGVATVVCVSSAVAGELLQDFKVGYILGGTPRKIQMAELIAVVVASLVMYFPLMLLHEANIKAGGVGFGDRQLSAPQAGLMATLAMGIVGGEMPWPLVVVGIFMGIGLIMMQVRSPMLVAVGMYLPFETTFAIFLGGVFRSLGDWVAQRRGFNQAQKARVENAGVLTASGLIAGEAILGLVWAGLQFAPAWARPQVFSNQSYVAGIAVMIALAVLMIRLPLSSAGDPNEPAPPVAMM
ncbi:MAG: oligopeptide transporter, OPT family [Acidobacteria bacterium]|nr:MAG: oligopeptide transporter, OPT family [Acidobacteriales bacterium 13_1_40CM_3_55_5]PYX10631.1 MAG: oligopeptide transporter, OPT family [Acidobacteriota bacterium]PYX17219.1 MAG: oligopeptide transporter, OPT family [Acidobacteriota bacterium]